MAGSLWVMHPVSFGASAFEGTSDQGLQRGQVTVRPPTDGNPFPGALARVGATARLAITGYDLAAGLGLTGLNGAAVANLAAFAAKLDGGAGKASGSVHTKYLMALAYAIPRRISASHGALARLSVEAIGYATGGGDPVAVSLSQALPASAGGAPDLFTLGPVEINGTTIADKASVEVDFGVQEMGLPCDGDVGIKAVVTAFVAPTIRLVTYDTTVANTIAGALNASGDGVEVWFRKYAGAGFAGTGEHVKLSAANALIVDEGWSASANGALRNTFRVDTWDSGADANPLVLAVDASLP